MLGASASAAAPLSGGASAGLCEPDWQDRDVTDTEDSAGMIGTERLLIRPWSLDEVDRLFDLYRRREVTRWFAPAPMRDRAEAVERIERNLAGLAADPRFGSWAVVERDSGVPAGTVVLKRLPKGDGEIEIGWHLHPDRWGRGYASEAARALLARGFADGLQEVWAVTDPANHRSMAVCRRIGLRLLGITSRWYGEPSMMFWAGSDSRRVPSLSADEPLPAPRPDGIGND
jgi:RimJ/RimL family protein N-acetyltransferase